MGTVGAALPALGGAPLIILRHLLKAAARLRDGIESGFLRSVAMLVGGTAAAQIIWFVATPILTRLYSASDFSAFGAFVAVMSMLSIVACLGYDSAVVIPEEDGEAATLLALSVYLSLLTGLVCLVLILLFPATLKSLFGQFASISWILAPVLSLAAIYSALQFWIGRRKRFGDIAGIRVLQASGGVGGQIGLGALGVGSLGLVLGQAVNFVIGCVLLGRQAAADVAGLRRAKELVPVRTVAWRYREFALITTPASLANSASVQVPLLIIAAAGEVAEAGFVFLAMRVMQAPLATIGAAVSQVYYSEASEAHRDGSLPALTDNVLGGLAKFGLGPLIFGGIVGAPAFEIVFGDGWGRAGELVAWMVPWLALQFLASPISMLVYAMESHRTHLALQILGVVVRVAPVLAASYVAPELLPEVFAITGAIFYAAYLVVLCRICGISPERFSRAISKAFGIVAAWVVLGIVIRFALYYLTSLQ